MTTVTVLHNISPSAGFGLNMAWGPVAGAHYMPRQHELVRVFEFDESDLTGAPVKLSPQTLADMTFRAFTTGHQRGNPNLREHALATAYRARRLRSLATGDVLVFAGTLALACRSDGWDPVPVSDLLVLAGEQADRAIRHRYPAAPDEALFITVPWEKGEAL